MPWLLHNHARTACHSLQLAVLNLGVFVGGGGSGWAGEVVVGRTAAVVVVLISIV